MITRGPSDCKGKKKRAPEDVLSVEQEPWTRQEVKFRPSDKVTETLQNGLLVISVRLNKYEVRQVFVDIGISINLLTLEVYNKLSLDKSNLTKVSYPLVELGDKTMAVLGIINLPLVLGNEKHKREVYAKFAVVDIPLTILNCHGIVIYISSLCLKLRASGGLVVVRGSQNSAQECYRNFKKVSEKQQCRLIY